MTPHAELILALQDKMERAALLAVPANITHHAMLVTCTRQDYRFIWMLCGYVVPRHIAGCALAAISGSRLLQYRDQVDARINSSARTAG
jgi:hypothetical protein